MFCLARNDLSGIPRDPDRRRPAKTLKNARKLIARAHNLAIGAVERSFAPKARICPCCRWSGFRFRSFAVVEQLRTGVICPRCGSFERHRALARYYPTVFADLGIHPQRLIHCAPEPSLRHVLTALCERYETSGFGEAGPTDHRLDLTQIALPHGSCDAFVLNHVLDCMPFDGKAVSELFRVLRPGGVVLAIVTLEDGVTTREVPVASNTLHRVYGSADIATRFAPFHVSIVDASGGLPPRARKVLGIVAPVPLVIMRKPFALQDPVEMVCA